MFEFAPIPETQRDVFNIDPSLERQEALRRLPFVAAHHLHDSHPRLTVVHKQIAVAVGRIVSSTRDIENWAGDGGEKRNPEGQNVPSYNHALQLPGSLLRYTPEDPIQLTIFQDRAGEYWATAHQGTHRVIAAKAYDMPSIEADVKMPENIQDVARYDGDVIAEAQTQH